LAGHSPAPALLHGDLWGGNWASTGDGVPVVFDPAAYYGDPEADLAMTALFGGFGEEFYQAYCELRPRRAGWRERADLYNLYHVLNHANLFGGAYVQQACGLMRHLLALTRG
ncbi:MAG TPA: fructosamine kinase family protein, partial [Steroidobacteraceae bacterium]|nr:fructosamine kinase family protein [Steroidobacteraceae bacterium]